MKMETNNMEAIPYIFTLVFGIVIGVIVMMKSTDSKIADAVRGASEMARARAIEDVTREFERSMYRIPEGARGTRRNSRGPAGRTGVGTVRGVTARGHDTPVMPGAPYAYDEETAHMRTWNGQPTEFPHAPMPYPTVDSSGDAPGRSQDDSRSESAGSNTEAPTSGYSSSDGGSSGSPTE